MSAVGSLCPKADTLRDERPSLQDAPRLRNRALVPPQFVRDRQPPTRKLLQNRCIVRVGDNPGGVQNLRSIPNLRRAKSNIPVCRQRRIITTKAKRREEIRSLRIGPAPLPLCIPSNKKFCHLTSSVSSSIQYALRASMTSSGWEVTFSRSECDPGVGEVGRKLNT
jgi:hypothetical protein